MLATMRAIVEQVAQQPSLESALMVFVSQVRQAINTQCCSIYVADPTQNNFVLMATDGLNPRAVGRFRLGFDEGLVGLVAKREEPINIACAKNHPHFKAAELVQEDRYSAFLSVPVIHKKRVLGVIVVQQETQRLFSQDEESFLITLSAQLASQLADAEVKKLLKQDEVSNKSSQLSGTAGTAGVAIGQAYVMLPNADFNSVELQKTCDPVKQKQLLIQAVAATRQEFSTLIRNMQGKLPPDALAVFEVYLQLLDAKSLGRDVDIELADGWCAKSALKRVIERLITQFNAMQDPYIKERAIDIKDIGLRVLHHLLHTEQANKHYFDNTILVAHTLTPSMLLQVPQDKLAGVVSVHGGVNSHAAILTRAMAIPAVWGISDIPLLQFDNKTMIVDGFVGCVHLSPDAQLQQQYQQIQQQNAHLQQQFLAQADLPCVTKDKVAVTLQLNAGLMTGAQSAQAINNGGVGLYRTESWFMEKSHFPTQKEQENWYQQVLQQHHPAPVVMRTLDIGGDKLLDYFNIAEDNPFLGWRGIRMSLDHPELFLDQLKAMIKANAKWGNLRILLPMISAPQEVDEALALLEKVYSELSENEPHLNIIKPPIGIMLEVPSSLYLLPEWAKKVDFCSVGSNDLTQYLLAVDRTNERVANLYSAYHPAVLRALNDIATQCKTLSLPFSLCGELAGEAEGAILLIAMGYTQLSMNQHAQYKVKWLVRQLHFSDMHTLLASCLAMENEAQVREKIQQFMVKQGLSPLFFSEKSVY